MKNLQDLDTALVHDEPFTLGFGSLATHKQCLELYLRAGPDPTVDFFAALQSLPEWLSEHAVAMPFVLIELNQRIGLLDVNGMTVKPYDREMKTEMVQFCLSYVYIISERTVCPSSGYPKIPTKEETKGSRKLCICHV